MPRRLPQTLADYVVVAIAPTLIALMVGALLFFLVELLYPAEWHVRLRWVYGWYVIAIVGISRISLEEGWAYASIFAAALSVAVALVVPPTSWPLLAVVWWAAHQLTRDTTLIDELEDASGEGLWETAVGGASGPSGPEGTPRTPPSRTSPPEEQTQPDRQEPALTTLGRSVRQWLAGEELARPHAPGRWVIYFCVAAVPLFGLGGWLLPGGSRFRAMALLVVYTACGLGLLLSTSFLGLRRYLRQRQVVMPPEMTAVWLAAGGLTIAATLLLAGVLPRPSPQVSMVRLVELAALNVRRASPWGWGREGLPDDTTPQAATTPGQPDAADHPSAGRPGSTPSSGDDASHGQAASQAPSEFRPAAESRSQKSSTSSSRSLNNNSSQGGADAGSQAGASQADSSQSQRQSKVSVASQGGDARSQPQKSSAPHAFQPKNDREAKATDNARQADRDGKASQDVRQAERGQARQADSASTQGHASEGKPRVPAGSPESSPATRGRNWAELPGGLVRGIGQGLAHLLRLAVTLGGLCLIAFVLWTYRAELAEAWRKLLEALAGLWGPRTVEEDRPDGPAVRGGRPPVPFAAFPDPFATGAAARMPWPELVRYTFSALEAWAREQGCPRRADQTPQEFVLELLRARDLPGQPFKALAGWYSELAYGPRQGPRARPLAPLQELWQALGAWRRAPAEAGQAAEG